MAKKDYEKGWIAVDAAIFTIHDSTLMILLHKRDKAPYEGKMELLGGLMLPKETAEQTLARKLKATFSTGNIFFEQFHTFTKPDRDPRERAVSVGFIALVCPDKISDLANWYNCSHLPALAFDHKEVVAKAREHLKKNVSSLIVKQFMPTEFPLNSLQDAYEIIEGIEYDNRNFRKKMISSGIVEETGKMEKGVSHRPAKLYRFKK